MNRRLPTSEDQRGWQAQLRASIRTAAGLASALRLTEKERVAAQQAERAGFPISVTPHYLSLIDPVDPECPLRRQVVPRQPEGEPSAGDLRDPLGEEAHEVAPDLIRRYPDRALLLVNDRCAVYCRFCTRSRMVGAGGGARSLARLGEAFAYLRQHPQVRDVIVSGGDPLTLATGRLLAIIETLRGIGSVETIRLATRVPVVLPDRVDAELLQALRQHHPIWVMTHFNHPREVDERAGAAVERLADAGFPVMNQTVLLRGVNDSLEVLSELFRRLVRRRVRPYYLLQMDPVSGTGHLRTPLQTGIDLMEGLQGRLSGIALPKFIVDAPGGFGKVPVGPDYVVERRQDAGGQAVTRVRTPRGVEVDYFDPEGHEFS